MAIQQIDTTTQTEIVPTLSEKLRAYYVFPGVAEEICERLQKHLEDCTDPLELDNYDSSSRIGPTSGGRFAYGRVITHATKQKIGHLTE